MQRLSWSLAIASAASALILAACGGGGSSSPSSGTLSGASAEASSSGTVTAFGSVFVNGHEFATGGAKVIDDDDGTTSDTSSLEVGMSVDVKASANSSEHHPEAAEIHVHPLVRGVVDGSDPSGTLTVMGQSIQLTASTVFSDHRACVGAATSPCTAITGQSDLTATSGSGSSAAPGSYVTVYGFLFASDPSSSDANIVATLVSVADTPASTRRIAYKAEGVVKSVGTGSITIGGLAVDLSAATCRAKGAAVPCATAFSAGQVVSAIGAKAPALPATSFSADTALLRGKIAVETPGATVEVEGKVSAVTASPASFVVRGITVDASALTGPLPVVGDVVVVTGTVSSDGASIVASAVKVLHAAKAATFAFEGDATGVVAGSSADTWVLTVLGQSMLVNSSTRLRDFTARSDPSNPFNISTFQTYLAASASQHLIVRTQADAAGSLTATSVTIVPASTTAVISGIVDATPAPANGSGSAMPTTFAVHGLSVSTDPAAIVRVVALHNSYGFGGMGRTAGGTVAAGDRVLVFGKFASNTLTVTAPVSATSVVLDFGAGLRDKDCDGF